MALWNLMAMLKWIRVLLLGQKRNKRTLFTFSSLIPSQARVKNILYSYNLRNERYLPDIYLFISRLTVREKMYIFHWFQKFFIRPSKYVCYMDDYLTDLIVFRIIYTILSTVTSLSIILKILFFHKQFVFLLLFSSNSGTFVLVHNCISIILQP